MCFISLQISQYLIINYYLVYNERDNSRLLFKPFFSTVFSHYILRLFILFIQKFNHRHQMTEQLFLFFDILSIVLSLILSILIYGIGFSSPYLSAVIIAIICYILISKATHINHIEPGRAIQQHTGLILFSSCMTFALLLLFAYLTKTTATYSRITITLWFFLMPSTLILWRFLAYQILLKSAKNHTHLKRVAILGANKVGNEVAKSIQDDISLGYQLVGFYDDRKEVKGRIAENLHTAIIGTFHDAFTSAQSNEIDIIYISLPFEAEKRITTLLNKLSDTTVSVHIIPNFFGYNIAHARWHDIGTYQALSLHDTPFYGVGSIVKKMEDIILASVILLFISIPMIIIAISIKLTSSGPIIFKQKRYGINGQELIIYKFRSMSVCDDGNIIKQAQQNDSRVTKLGAFLRKTSLDELPQFLNVLNGSMSIVGPRPHAVAHNEEYRKKVNSYMLRHLVKPGITGWAQINGYRGETKYLEQMEKRIEYDLYYIRNWSLLWDLKIIFMTILKGFTSKNAY